MILGLFNKDSHIKRYIDQGIPLRFVLAYPLA